MLAPFIILLITTLVAASNNGSEPQHGLKHFTLDLTWEKRSPAGFERNLILVNGQHPGPVLEIDQGQDVVVDVHNYLPFNTTIHYHGMRRK